MRKLATIEKIVDIQPIPGADAVEAVRVADWTVVSQKGIHQVGGMVIHVQPDAIPPFGGPFEPLFSFLWAKEGERPNNYYIKPAKIRGQRSHGIILPLSEVYGIWIASINDRNFPDLRPGTDFTEFLGLTKHEDALPKSQEIVGGFLPGVSKTDEERVQSTEGNALREALLGRPYVITEKADGASMTMAIEDGEFAVYGRKYRLREDGGAYWRAARAYPFEEMLRSRAGLAVQGEVVGPGVQKNYLGLSDNMCLIFNAVDRLTGRRLDYDEACLLLPWDAPKVNLLERGQSFNYTTRELEVMSNGRYSGTDNLREGIVIRSNDKPTPENPQVSFKVISPEFTDKHKRF